jgi:ferrochelatase
MEIVSITGYHLHPGYIAALVACIREGLDWLTPRQRSRALLLFSAHGVPERLPRSGDPYVHQIHETVEAVMDALGRDREYRLGFQSRTGPVKWVGPGTEEVIEQLAGHPAVVVVPVAFVSDHIETLYEIDMLFADLARAKRIRRFVRIPSLNSSPLFLQALADLVEPLLEAG